MWALGAWLKRLQFASMTRWGRRKGRVSPCRDSANESCDLKELWLVTLGKVRLAPGNISTPRGTQKCGNREKSLLDQDNVLLFMHLFIVQEFFIIQMYMPPKVPSLRKIMAKCERIAGERPLYTVLSPWQTELWRVLEGTHGMCSCFVSVAFLACHCQLIERPHCSLLPSKGNIK